MITIHVKADVNGNYTAFSIVGHAEYGEAGQDIVCAAVSALGQTALLGLLKYAAKQVTYTVKAGALSVSLQKTDERTQVIMDTMILGLREITTRYGDYVVLALETSGGGRNV
ncbi:ribosomal-processing cysteine protease Prp [uncultured Megasphaera sp.]|uniref:ribosomal-processing cysteine protease Prp n=1 Tax=uncultured Megasphaera sp. TaxID=165188 RepID=UPI00288A0BA9|nr:ribosomal-processing cysteine protease Prp [uncultured Megasphaera sp.]